MSLLPHLVYISGEYKQNPTDSETYPISELDCTIIMQFIAILKGAGLNREAALMSRWKQQPDEELNLDLQIFMESNEIPDFDQEDPFGEGHPDSVIPQLKMIDIEGSWFVLSYISRIDKIDNWSDEAGDQVYGVVINKAPMPAKYNWYEDTIIEIGSERQRDDFLDELKKKMEDLNVKFI